MLKWPNLEFTFEVGGILVAADAMFLMQRYLLA